MRIGPLRSRRFVRGRRSASIAGFVAVFAPLLGAQDRAPGVAHWPAWRGPLGTGESPDGTPPLRWSEDENVAWKVRLPGAGSGTPVVFGDTIYVLTAEPVGEPVREPEPIDEGVERKSFERKVTVTHRQRFAVHALDLSTGAIRWTRTAAEALPHETIHEDGSWAASSAVTDGEHVFADFGSRGIHAFRVDGSPAWSADLGEMSRLGFGEGTSPALFGDTLVVQHDHEGASFVVAFDKATGEERWRRARDEPSSWSTPVFATVDGRTQVLVSGARKVRGYDLATGREVWECAGLTRNVIPSPVQSDGVAFFMSGFRRGAILAIRLAGARGDVTEGDAVLWTASRNAPYVRSPLLLEDALYFLKSEAGILSSVAPRTGKELLAPTRLENLRGFYASPVAANGRIYLVGADGATEVLRHGPKYEVLSVNHLDDRFSASPAIAGSRLLLRGEANLYCLAE